MIDELMLEIGRKLGREVVHLDDHRANARDQKVIAEHRRNCDAERSHGRDQRAGNAGRHGTETGCSRHRDAAECIHHPPDRA